MNKISPRPQSGDVMSMMTSSGLLSAELPPRDRNFNTRYSLQLKSAYIIRFYVVINVVLEIETSQETRNRRTPSRVSPSKKVSIRANDHHMHTPLLRLLHNFC